MVSPFDLSRTLLVGGGLLVPCSLPGPPVIKQLMQMVTMVPASVGGFNQCASPNRLICGWMGRWMDEWTQCRKILYHLNHQGSLFPFLLIPYKTAKLYIHVFINVNSKANTFPSLVNSYFN